MAAPRSQAPIITLTTDFGGRDHYVASMKGVLLSLNPEARIVDITHEISPQQVVEAGFVLACAFAAFPKGSVHVLVVDPGVGTSRRLLLAQTDRYFFLAPDNGALGLVFEREPPRIIYHLTAAHYFQPEPSATFHGRDILAPAAAWLARGIPPDRFGEPLAEWTPFPIAAPTCSREGRMDLQVLAIDRFGNVILNLTQDVYREAERRFASRRFELAIGERSITRRFTTYAECPDSNPFTLFNSAGFLEIALREGSAAAMLGCRTGQPARLQF